MNGKLINVKNLTTLPVRQLLQFDNEIISMSSSIVGFFFRTKINEFYNTNGERIKSLRDKNHQIYLKHCEFKDDKLVFSADQKPVLKEGVKEEDFHKDLNEFLNENVTVNL